jgi:hypothetical protein
VGNNCQSGNGGGIMLSNSLTTITSTVIEDCLVHTGEGGGLWIGDGSDVALDHVLLSYNQTLFDAGVTGGMLVQDSVVQLHDVRVTENEAHGDMGFGGGGGARFQDSQVTGRDVTIAGNMSATNNGGGLSLRGASLVDLDRLEVVDNTAYGIGGGIYADSDAPVTLTNVVLTGNQTLLMGQGGGLAHTGDATCTLRNAVVTGNVAAWDAYGGGISVNTGRLVMDNVVVAGNESGGTGGGIGVSTGMVEATNVTVVGNSAVGEGGGVWLGGIPWTATGITISENTASTGGGVACDACTATFGSSNVWANVPDDFIGIDDPTGIDGNISMDPELLDITAADPADWDVHLSASSALVNACDTCLDDPDGSTADTGAFGGPGAAEWDLDGDGYPGWWQPGPYDYTSYPALGWDCDDRDIDVYPGNGC